MCVILVQLLYDLKLNVDKMSIGQNNECSFFLWQDSLFSRDLGFNLQRAASCSGFLEKDLEPLSAAKSAKSNL